MAKHSFFDLLGGYSTTRDTGKQFVSREISGSMTQGMRRFLSARIFAVGRAVSDFFSHVASRAYGAAMLSFGLLALLLHFVGVYPDESVANPIIAAMLSIISVPLLLSEKPLPLLLQDFAVTDYMFFEFFCIKRFNRMESGRKFPIFAALLIGALLAVLGIAFPVWQIVLAVVSLAFLYVSFVSPEFAFFTTFLLMPYLDRISSSEVLLCILITVSTLSFFRKVLYGKRVINLEQYDLLFAAMIFMILLSGIFVKGVESFKWSVEMLIMTAGYILASNIITNRRIAERSMNSIVISSLPPSVISIVTFVRAVLDGEAASLVDRGIGSTFSSPDILAVFLIVAIVFSVAMVKSTHNSVKLLYIAAIAINSVALVLTGELFAVLALLLGIVAYSAIKGNRWAMLLPLLLFLPYALLLLPASLLDRAFAVIPSLSSVHETLSLWSLCFSVFLDNIFVGIGIGKECFAEEMVQHGVVGFENSSNLFLELGLEAGALALVCFLLLLLVRLRHRVRYYPYIKNSELSKISPMSEICIFCLIAYGAYSYIWADTSMYYLFCCVFGIASATLRVARKEYNDRIFYYEDTRASDSSVVDVEII